MKKHLLINPQLDSIKRYNRLANGGSFLPPFGLLNIASYATAKGFNIEIIDLNVTLLEDTLLLLKIKQEKYLSVGLTAVTLSIKEAGRLANLIKKMNNNISLIIGGPHISGCPIDVLKDYDSFDWGIIGEGEVPYGLTLNDIENNHKVSNKIPGLVYKKNGEIAVSENRSYLKDLNPDEIYNFNLLPKLKVNYSLPPHSSARLPSSGIITSRGCNGRCTFCDRSVSGMNVRLMKAEKIFQLMQSLKEEHGINDIQIADDNFCISKKRISKLCSLIKEKNLDFSWSCIARIDDIDLKVIKNMIDAGCWQIAFGIESGSQNTLDRLKKGINIKKIRHVVKKLFTLGISVRGFFIIGFPWETEKDILQTIDFACELELSEAHFSIYTPYPNTELGKKYNTSNKTWHLYNQQTVVYDSGNIEPKQLLNLYEYAFVKFYYSPNRQKSFRARLSSINESLRNRLLSSRQNISTYLECNENPWIREYLFSILDKAYDYCLKKFKQKLTMFPSIVNEYKLFHSHWHGITHSLRVAVFATAMANFQTYQEAIDLDIIILSALFHDIGRNNEKKDDLHHIKSISLFQKHYQDYCSNSKIVKEIISAHNDYELNFGEISIEGACICNADRLDRYRLGKEPPLKKFLIDTVPWRPFFAVAKDFIDRKNHFKIMNDLV